MRLCKNFDSLRYSYYSHWISRIFTDLYRILRIGCSLARRPMSLTRWQRQLSTSVQNAKRFRIEKTKETNEEIWRNGMRWLLWFSAMVTAVLSIYLELKAPGVVRGSGHNNDPGRLYHPFLRFSWFLIQCCQTDFWWKEISLAQLQRLMDEAGNRAKSFHDIV